MYATEVETRDHARRIAVALVDREERVCGSRMAAYDRVTRTLGVSPSWLRKLVGRQDVGLAAHVYENLKHTYQRACDRLEAEAEAEKRAFLALGGKDAADESAGDSAVLEGAPTPSRTTR